MGGGAALVLGVAAFWMLPGLTSLPAGASPPAPPSPRALPGSTEGAVAAPAASVDLDTAIRTSPSGSLEAALDELRSLWGPGPLEEVAFRAHLNQLRRLDLPVVLEMFHPARRDTTYLPVLQIDGETATVATAPGVRVPVRLADLDLHWTRAAHAVWRDFDGVLRQPDPERVSSWIGTALARRGFSVGPAGLADAVARFQSARDLTPDGIVGSRTLMTLYSLGDYPRPHLSKGAS
jgi:hypothetical protein